jgi:hypothetical protein
MARRVILDTQYTFTPGTRTITLPRYLPAERLLLITNVTRNTVIYNFSDPVLSYTSYTFAQPTNNNTNPTTTIVLSYNTTSMSATDKISIVVDEVAEIFTPDEALIDPVGKMRVSTGQALIDTDFEYGLQPTKWETLTLLNNRPGFYVNTQYPLNISNVVMDYGSTKVTVFANAPVPSVSTPFIVQDSTFPGGNGPFVVETANSTAFTYTAKYPALPGSGNFTTLNSGITQIYAGNVYSGASYVLPQQPTLSGNVVTVYTTEPHGLQIGDGVFITAAGTTGGGPIIAGYAVTQVTNSTSFSVVSERSPTGTVSNAVVYPRPDGVYAHRAFDGGVQFTTGTPAHNNQLIRQTRRYFRYQSGKGIQISTGTIIKPNFNIDELNAGYLGSPNTYITVTTKLPHQLNPGVNINVSGANETAFNGNYNVAYVINPNQFVYVANATPTANVASGFPAVSANTWYGAINRLGMYDNQNGIYFEFDGQQLYLVRRKSTDQIAGFVNVTAGSATVTGLTVNGVTTKFSKQLIPGDYVVIRGASYRILDITSDTSMTISPAFRGTTLAGSSNYAIVSKTVETRVPQSQFNIDRLDGTGPSGYFLDLSKMQMFYLDYSWYGAGTIRCGFRDIQGRVFYCHRFVNNNQNTEAWMRSGNLPARYETNNFALRTTLAANVAASDTTLLVSNTAGFPSNGTLLIANSVAFEYVNYTGIANSTSFTGLTRGKPANNLPSVTSFANSANLTTISSTANIMPGMMIHSPALGLAQGTFVYQIIPGSPNSTIVMSQAALANVSGTFYFGATGPATNAVHVVTNTAPVAVYHHAPFFSPTISHWGTSVIMDGQYDNDKSLVFTYGEANNTVISPNTEVALLSLRVSPAVDSGVPATYGSREIMNRMQLTLNQVDVLVSGQFLINLILNGQPVANGGVIGNFARIAPTTSSLAQIADHQGNVAILAANSAFAAGESILSFYAVNTAGSNNYSTIQQDLTKLRDLGNSILGGGTTNASNTNIYPDGPDVLTVTARNIGLIAANAQVRLSWTEAQA